MSNFSKIGVSMLNMDDLADYLKIARGFMLRSDDANDTKNVSGVKSQWIAIADTSKHNPDGTIKVDRETIKNSLHLDGHDAEYFATKDYADSINKDTVDIRKNYNLELEDLRDEFYQLRTELIKRGIMNRYTPYAGFYDVFRTGDPMHVEKVCDHTVNDSLGADAQRSVHVSDSFFDSVEVGDHLYLYDNETNGGKGAVVEIDKKGDDHETLHFTVGTGFDIKKGMVDIYRSKGTVMNGLYSFGEIKNYQVDDSIAMYTGLNDDTYSKSVPLDKDNPGYAYTFRVPKNMQKSYLSKISIMAQSFGQPGDLIAYVIDEQNIAMWNRLRKAEIEGERLPEKDDSGQKLPTKTEDLIIAKSQPLTIDSSLGMHQVDFNFYGTERNVGSSYGFSNPNPYPYLPLQDDEVNHRVRYCLIIEPVGQLDKYDPSNVKNCFLIEFIKQVGDGSDLQLNNTMYHYDRTQKEPLTTNSAVNKYDLYYGITLLRAVEKVFVPLGSGIYTARFEQPTPIKASHARLMMRISREGMFHVAKNTQTTSVGNVGDHTTLTIESEDGAYTPDFSGSKGHQVVIGHTICDVEDSTNAGSMTIAKGFHIDSEAPVYPIGYEVSIKAYYDEWDPVHFTTITKYQQKFKMPLVALIPDQYKTDNTISDRLIFESDFRDEKGNVRPFNRYELEVFWHKSRDKNDTVKVVNGTNEYPLAAAIHDLSLSLDRVM